MNVFWYGVFIAAIAWLAYHFGWQRGAAIGYQEGWEDGVKQGKEEGTKIGVKNSIKEKVLNDIAGTKGGMLADVEQQVRQELLAALTAKPTPPQKPLTLMESLFGQVSFGWWVVMFSLLALTIYVAIR